MTSLPNLLTLSRIAAVPVMVALLMVGDPWAAWAALALFVAASVTDWLDGYLARRMGVVSALGRFLDPIADKLLVAAVIMLLVADGRIGGAAVLAALVILIRELLISGLREFLAGRDVAVPVSRLAKWKTAVQMTALAVLIVATAVGDVLVLVGETLLWLAAVLTIVTGYDYMRVGIKHIMAEA